MTFREQKLNLVKHDKSSCLNKMFLDFMVDRYETFFAFTVNMNHSDFKRTLQTTFEWDIVATHHIFTHIHLHRLLYHFHLFGPESASVIEKSLMNDVCMKSSWFGWEAFDVHPLTRWSETPWVGSKCYSLSKLNSRTSLNRQAKREVRVLNKDTIYGFSVAKSSSASLLFSLARTRSKEAIS